MTEVAKNLLWLVQGGIAAFNLAVSAWLIAKGQREAAAALIGKSARQLSNINVALNVLNVAHGLVLVIFGNGEDRVAGAVEATWGGSRARGAVGPALSRFTEPLGAAILITNFTISRLGDVAVGAVYGLVKLGLDMAYGHAANRTGGACDIDAPRRGARERRRTPGEGAQRATGDADGRVAVEPEGLGGKSDPGTYKPLRERFKPVWDAPLETDTEMFTTAEIFLSIVVGCFTDAQQILEEAVAASIAREN